PRISWEAPGSGRGMDSRRSIAGEVGGMFGNRARSDASIEGMTPRRRREGRGLGPFSSGHLTIIIVTVVIVVAFPFAAYAVTGSNVFVTDAVSGKQATVFGSSLALKTAIGDPTTQGEWANVDPGTGANGTKGFLDTSSHLADYATNTPAKINSLGQLSVAATGSVTATQTPPGQAYNSGMT